MKIIINTRPLLGAKTGIGQYTFNLSKKLKEIDKKNNYFFYYGFVSKILLDDNTHSNFWLFRILRRMIKKNSILSYLSCKIRLLVYWFIRIFSFNNFDLYFEPNFIPEVEIKAKKIVTMVFDLSAILYPEWHPKERLDFFNHNFKKRISKSDIVITATQFMKEEIVKYLNVNTSKVFVTPIDCDKDIFKVKEKSIVEQFCKEMSLPDKFILFVGSIEPRKNILNILKAFVFSYNNTENNLHLVFCGPPGWKNIAIFDFIRKNNLATKIHFLHYITEEELCLLYNCALALVYPSFYEGFGLPPLEAMSCGCPAIVSDIPVHREVCGDAVIYVDPNSPEQISEAILRLLEEPALLESLRIKGLEQSKKFSWDKTARETLKIFERTFSN